MIARDRHAHVVTCALASLCWMLGSPAMAQAPASGRGAAVTCRTAATSITSVAGTPAYTATVTTSCSFDSATARGRCLVQFRDPRGTSTSTTETVYASVADFVDEVRVVPPLMKAQSSASVTVGAGTTSKGAVVNTFDAQGRLTRTVSTGASGVQSTTAYSAWDAAGRPTVATDIGPGFNSRREIRYDDVRRTRTTVVRRGPVTTVEYFDANGNPTRQTTQGGGSGTMSVITTNATTRVCK